MADRYWVNDDTDGLWNNANNWSASTGGAGGAGVPGASDNVYFDGNGVDSCRLNAALNITSLTIAQLYSGTIDDQTDDLNHAVSGNVTLQSTNTATSALYTFNMGGGTWTVGGNWDQLKVNVNCDYTGTLKLTGTTKIFKTYLAVDHTPQYPHIVIDDHATIDMETYNYDLIVSSLIVKTGATCTIDGFSGKNVTAGRSGDNRTIDVQGTGTLTSTGFTTGKLIWKGYHVTDSFLSVAAGATFDVSAFRMQCNKGLIKSGTVIGCADVEISNWGESKYYLEAGTVTFNGDVDFVNTGAFSGWNFGGAAKAVDYVFKGDVLFTGGATLNWVKGTGTITFEGTVAQSIGDFDDDAIEDIVLNKSAEILTLTESTVSTDSLTLTDGTLDIDGKNLTTVGNVTMAAGSVCQDTTGGGTITVGGNLDINGINGTPCTWNGPDLTITGTADADWTTVTNSDASGGTEVDATDDCTNSGGNTNWDFGAGGEEHVKNLSDTINLSDARIFLFGLNRSDSISLSDSPVKNIGRPVTDSIAMSDGITKNVGLTESDSIAMSDGITKAPGLTKSDTITLSDNASIVVAFLRSLNDTINLSDNIAKEVGLGKADTITMSDNLVSTIIAIIMNINDTINLSDGIVKNVGTARADTINLSDNFGKVIAYLRSFADTITLSDLGYREAGLNKADAVTLSDGMTKEPRLSKADIVTLSESIAKEMRLSKADTITLSDFFSSDAGIVWTNIIIKGIDIMSGEPVFITGKYRLP